MKHLVISYSVRKCFFYWKCILKPWNSLFAKLHHVFKSFIFNVDLSEFVLFLAFTFVDMLLANSGLLSIFE